MGRHLLRKGRAKRSTEDTLRLRILKLRGFKRGRAEGEWKSGEDFFIGWIEGESKRRKSPREHVVPSRTKPLGSDKGHGFKGGRKPLKHRSKAERFWRKVQERRDEGAILHRSPLRRKALKGEAQECWELKEASKGLRSKKAIERVAKP